MIELENVHIACYYVAKENTMKTPLNVMVEVSTMQRLEDMAHERRKTRTAMIAELIDGTSKGRVIGVLCRAWFKESKGQVTAEYVEQLIELLKS